MIKESLEIIIKSLVDDKESVIIKESSNDKVITLEVSVSESDMGKIIGKQGRVAKSIRTVIKAIAGREQKKVNVEFIG